MTRSSIRKSVRQVNLSDNDLKQIDAKFWLNLNLEEIILSGNKNLELIPDQVATLTKLQILDLSGTSLKKVNDLLWSLPKLKVLNLSRSGGNLFQNLVFTHYSLNFSLTILKKYKNHWTRKYF